MRRRNIFMGGVLLGTTLLCLGMNPGRATVATAQQPKAKAKAVAPHVLKQLRPGRTFIQMTKDSTGVYAIDDYCDAHALSYRIEAGELVFEWAQGDTTKLVIQQREDVGTDRVFAVATTSLGSERVHFTPLDSLGILWDIAGEGAKDGKVYSDGYRFLAGDRYIDSAYAHTVPIRRHPCPHPIDDSAAFCGRDPELEAAPYAGPAIPEPAVQAPATKVIAEDWQHKTFYDIAWEPQGMYALRYVEELKPFLEVRGDTILRSTPYSYDTLYIQRSEARTGLRLFKVYRKNAPERVEELRVLSLEPTGAIWTILGTRCVDGQHLDRVYVRRYVMGKEPVILYPYERKRWSR